MEFVSAGQRRQQKRQNILKIGFHSLRPLKPQNSRTKIIFSVDFHVTRHKPIAQLHLSEYNSHNSSLVFSSARRVLFYSVGDNRTNEEEKQTVNDVLVE